MTVAPDEFDHFLATVRDEPFRDLLIVTWETGCRPQESPRVEARHVDLENQRWFFPRTEAKKKKARVVYLTDRAAEVVRRLTERYPTGRLFRNNDWIPWTTDAVNRAFLRLQIRIGRRVLRERGLAVSDEEIEKLVPTLRTHRTVQKRTVEKMPAESRREARRKLTYRLARERGPKLSLYALRHAWATNALPRGVDPLTAGILMGHTDPSMIARVYQHVALNPRHMLEQAKKAVR